MTTAFISYSVDSDAHKLWYASLLPVFALAVWISHWISGTSYPGINCLSSWSQRSAIAISSWPSALPLKTRSDNRNGRGWLRGDIMTAEVMTHGTSASYSCPPRRDLAESAASGLPGKYYVDLSATP